MSDEQNYRLQRFVVLYFGRLQSLFSQVMMPVLGAAHYSHRAEIMRARIEKEDGATACDWIEDELKSAAV